MAEINFQRPRSCCKSRIRFTQVQQWYQWPDHTVRQWRRPLTINRQRRFWWLKRRQMDKRRLLLLLPPQLTVCYKWLLLPLPRLHLHQLQLTRPHLLLLLWQHSYHYHTFTVTGANVTSPLQPTAYFHKVSPDPALDWTKVPAAHQLHMYMMCRNYYYKFSKTPGWGWKIL